MTERQAKLAFCRTGPPCANADLFVTPCEPVKVRLVRRQRQRPDAVHLVAYLRSDGPSIRFLNSLESGGIFALRKPGVTPDARSNFRRLPTAQPDLWALPENASSDPPRKVL